MLEKTEWQSRMHNLETRATLGIYKTENSHKTQYEDKLNKTKTQHRNLKRRVTRTTPNTWG